MACIACATSNMNSLTKRSTSWLSSAWVTIAPPSPLTAPTRTSRPYAVGPTPPQATRSEPTRTTATLRRRPARWRHPLGDPGGVVASPGSGRFALRGSSLRGFALRERSAPWNGSARVGCRAGLAGTALQDGVAREATACLSLPARATRIPSAIGSSPSSVPSRPRRSVRGGRPPREDYHAGPDPQRTSAADRSRPATRTRRASTDPRRLRCGGCCDSGCCDECRGELRGAASPPGSPRCPRGRRGIRRAP